MERNKLTFERGREGKEAGRERRNIKESKVEGRRERGTK